MRAEQPDSTTTAHEDMHGGEGETSILLKYAPDNVRNEWETADHDAQQRPDLLVLGLRGYTKSGIIGKPSLASAEKGIALIEQLVAGVDERLTLLGPPNRENGRMIRCCVDHRQPQLSGGAPRVTLANARWQSNPQVGRSRLDLTAHSRSGRFGRCAEAVRPRAACVRCRALRRMS